MCLEVLQPLADIRDKFYLELKDKGFHNMLSFRYVVCHCIVCIYVNRFVCGGGGGGGGA